MSSLALPLSYDLDIEALASQVMPSHLILVHGEANNMSRLRSALKSKFAERKDDIQIYTPRNVEVVKLKFRGERMAKVRFSSVLSRLDSIDLTHHPTGPRIVGHHDSDSQFDTLRSTRVEGFHLHLPQSLRLA